MLMNNEITAADTTQLKDESIQEYWWYIVDLDNCVVSKVMRVASFFDCSNDDQQHRLSSEVLLEDTHPPDGHYHLREESQVGERYLFCQSWYHFNNKNQLNLSQTNVLL